MKRIREGSNEDEGPSPTRLRLDLVEARHAREKAELAKDLAVERAERRAERAELEKRVERAERRAEKAELEKRVERAELEKQFALEKAELEKQLALAPLASETECRVKQVKAKKKESSHPRPSIVAKKLPWLLDKAPMLKALPNALWGHILTFSTDDDLFKHRALSLTHYAAYFGQKVVPKPWVNAESYPYPTSPFNPSRAVSLARMGRRFPRVEVLHTDLNDMLSNAHLKAINPVSFPSLKALNLVDQNYTQISLSYLTTLQKVEHLDTSCLANQGWLVTEDKLPALKMLKICIHDHEENDGTPLPAKPHSRIEDLWIWVDNEELLDWSTVTKDAFPELKRIRGEIPDIHKARLASLGVDVADD